MTDLPGYDNALRRTLESVCALDVETLTLADARGRVLRQDVTADRDQPPFDRSAMDGFAVSVAALAVSGATDKAFRVAGAVPAGGTLDPAMTIDPANDVVRIATGAAVPAPFNAVVPIEKAVVDEAAGTVWFTVDGVDLGAAVHPRGADAAAEAVVIPAGTALGPHHLGIAATVGERELMVSRRPRVVVLSSGDEVWPVDTATDDLPMQAIRNSNGPMLVALLRAMGAEVVRHEHVVDEADAVGMACERAAGDADLVVTAGGVSVGQRDLFPAMWPTLGYEKVLHGVAMQPGKPVLVAAKHEARKQNDRGLRRASEPALVIGLPGNPVSVWATAHLFVWPMVRRLSGLDPRLPWRRVWLASPAKGNAKREAFRAVRLVGETREQVEVIAWQGSGDLMHTAAADGLLRMPIHGGEVPAGSGLSFLPVLDGPAGDYA
ncbi:MAG: molybdopterin molybdotransferase MoeA [Planctomycetota bacterium]